MDNIKILIADDEPRMRKLVKDFLVKSGFSVLEAGDGEEALEMFVDNKDIALIILDIMMPKTDGWECCREIRKLAKVPIIMLTAKRCTPLRTRAEEALRSDLKVPRVLSEALSRTV